MLIFYSTKPMLSFAIETARRAGALLMAGLERRRSLELKSAYEVVTEVDRESEALIVSAIRHAFPDHAILAEEGGGIERTSPFLWLIDPLDGTNNYAHGFPFFAVSIALMEDGELRLGVVFDPLRDELFSAERGAGAWRNNQRLRVSETPALAASLVSTGFPYDFATTTDNNTRQFTRIQARTQGSAPCRFRRARPGVCGVGSARCALGVAPETVGYRPPVHCSCSKQAVACPTGAVNPGTRGTTDWVASNGRIHDELIAALAE
jgi:myo-inositol-1(or 4)-monophosphatase